MDASRICKRLGQATFVENIQVQSTPIQSVPGSELLRLFNVSFVSFL